MNKETILLFNWPLYIAESKHGEIPYFETKKAKKWAKSYLYNPKLPPIEGAYLHEHPHICGFNFESNKNIEELPGYIFAKERGGYDFIITPINQYSHISWLYPVSKSYPLNREWLIDSCDVLDVVKQIMPYVNKKTIVIQRFNKSQLKYCYWTRKNIDWVISDNERMWGPPKELPKLN